MLESLAINKSSHLYRFLVYKIPHPEWRPLDAVILEEAIIYYVNSDDDQFPIFFENKIIEEITLALVYLEREKTIQLFGQIKRLVFELRGYPERGEPFMFRLKKAVAGALMAAEVCLRR